MPFAIGGFSRIRTNIPAENAYNSLEISNREISLRQLRLSTGKRINNAGDDVAGYITYRALEARNSSMKAALKAIGDAVNVTNILMDSLDNIYELMNKIKEATSNAVSGALGTSERVVLAKAAYSLAQQVQTVTDSTVFGGRQLLSGAFSAAFVIGTDGANNLLTIAVDMTTGNPNFNVDSLNFDINAMKVPMFAGVTNLDLRELNNVSGTNLGIFSDSVLSITLTSISTAIDNINKTASYLGGISNRMFSQEDLLKSQITNYHAAISRIQDADIAQEQLQLVKAQFVQQASLITLAQANANPQSYLRLLQG